MSQTSDRVSTIAADEIRSMAASLLRQDEVKGLRKIFRKVMGS